MLAPCTLRPLFACLEREADCAQVALCYEAVKDMSEAVLQ